MSILLIAFASAMGSFLGTGIVCLCCHVYYGIQDRKERERFDRGRFTGEEKS